jgi:hypothetical protein
MSLSNEKKQLLEQQVVKLNQKFPSLVYNQKDERDLVSGTLPFCVSYNNRTIKDEYEIEILIPDDYQNQPPTVKETKGKIPEKFHRNKDAGNTLCLGAPIAVAKKFKDNSCCLLHFVEEQVVPYLFSYSYYKEYNEMPFGELKHGGEGILSYYQEVFDISDNLNVLGLLRILADDDYRGHYSCPCGRGKRIRNCHGEILRDISRYQSPDDFLYEYKEACEYIINSKKKIPESLISVNLLKSLRRKNEKLKINF